MIIDVDESFYVILEKYLEGTISFEEREELRAKVASSPRCRREFVTTLQQEAMLRSVCQNKMSHSARFDAQKILQQDGAFSIGGHKKVRDSVRLIVSRNSSRRKVAAISVRTRQVQISNASWAAVGAAAAVALVLLALIGTGNAPEHVVRPERTAASTAVEPSYSSSNIPAVPLPSRRQQGSSAQPETTVADVPTPPAASVPDTETQIVIDEVVAEAPKVREIKPVSKPTPEERIAQARIFEPALRSQPMKISVVEGAQGAPPAVAIQDGIPAKRMSEPVPNAQKYARLGKLTGATATVVRGTQKLDAAAGEEFIAGDLLQIAQAPNARAGADTGCEVLLLDGSSVLLRPGAALRFAVVADLFRPMLESGEIFAQIKPQPENRAVIFSTLVGAEVAAFSASFRMGTDASARRVTLEVDSGQAYLRSQGVMRLVTAGRTCNTQQGVAPTEPKAQSGSSANGDGDTGNSGRATGQGTSSGNGNSNAGGNGGGRGTNAGGARGGGNAGGNAGGNGGGNAGGARGGGNAGGNAGGNGNGRGAGMGGGRGRP